jgi:cytoskeletal protein CcmA (bactofilin family)
MGKKDKKRIAADPGTISTLLGLDTEIEGTLQFKDTIRVDGKIRGQLVSEKGTVIVGEKATLDADVNVGVAIIRGTINGRVEARERIEVYAPAKVSGDISAPTVTIDSGVVFNGNCRMQSDAAAPETKPGAAAAKTERDDSRPKKPEKNL